MPLLNREGRFKALIINKSIAETGDSNLCTLQAVYKIQQELDGDQWYDVSEEDAEISGYHYFEKKDGSINTSTIEQVKAALGWDGVDIFALEAMDVSQVLVQITVKIETYDGKTRPKVKWLDHADADGGGIKRATPDEMKAIGNRLGSKLRANAGGTTVPTKPAPGKPAPVAAAAPAKPAGGPPKRPSGGAPTAPVAAPASPPLTVDDAWSTFTTCFAAGTEEAVIEREWFRLMGVIFPKRSIDSLTGDELAKFIVDAPPQITPF